MTRLLALLLILFLGGCEAVGGAVASAAGNMAATLVFGDRDAPPAGETEETKESREADEQARTLAQSVLDKLIAAETQDDRALRVCFGSLILVETLVDEVYRFGAPATEMAGLVRKAEIAIMDARAAEDSPWFETEMSDIAIDMKRALVDSLKARGRRVATELASAGSVSGIARGLLTSKQKIAVKREKVTAMLKDIDRFLQPPRTRSQDALWAICEARMVQNRVDLDAALSRS